MDAECDLVDDNAVPQCQNVEYLCTEQGQEIPTTEGQAYLLHNQDGGFQRTALSSVSLTPGASNGSVGAPHRNTEATHCRLQDNSVLL